MLIWACNSASSASHCISLYFKGAALARLRIKKCSVILADEPTGSLDGKNARLVMDILHRLNREGKTVIMVTHDESLIRERDRRIQLK